LDRALSTARPLAKALGQEVRVEPLLREIHAGIFQGLLWSEIEEKHPDEARRWRAYEPDFIVPGGESRRQLMDRGRAAFEAIRAEGPFDRVAVFTHGGLLGAAFKSLLEIPAELNPFGFFNGAISRVQWDSKIKLITLNETEHLRAANVAQLDRTGDL
jgi:probable phosphoglycerate mutase